MQGHWYRPNLISDQSLGHEAQNPSALEEEHKVCNEKTTVLQETSEILTLIVHIKVKV